MNPFDPSFAKASDGTPSNAEAPQDKPPFAEPPQFKSAAPVMPEFDLKAVYDRQVHPLVDQILKICEEHGLPLLMSFCWKHKHKGSDGQTSGTMNALFSQGRKVGEHDFNPPHFSKALHHLKGGGPPFILGMLAATAMVGELEKQQQGGGPVPAGTVPTFGAQPDKGMQGPDFHDPFLAN